MTGIRIAKGLVSINDKVRVYLQCIICKQSWPWAFTIDDGLAPRSAVGPAKCPKCRKEKP